MAFALAALRLLQILADAQEKDKKEDVYVGDCVRVRGDIREPKYKWGGVNRRSIGVAVFIDSSREGVRVAFPESSRWRGLMSELEIVKGLHLDTVCDGCNQHPILGERLRCMVCDDFDFCSACVKTLDHDHRFVRCCSDPVLSEDGQLFCHMDFVKVKSSVKKPNHGWQDVDKTSVGYVTAIDEGREGAVVCFDKQPKFLCQLSELEIAPVPHEQTKCSGCKKEVRGLLFKCRECDDFNFCEPCFLKDSKHDKKHPFQRISNPRVAGAIVIGDSVKPKPNLKSPKYGWGQISPQITGIVVAIDRDDDITLHCPMQSKWLSPMDEVQLVLREHIGIACDGCKRKNIYGLRFKCRQCDDYDLCENCFLRNKTHKHTFKRICNPIRGMEQPVCLHDHVRVKPSVKEPKHGWQNASRSSVGIVVSIDDKGQDGIVLFPDDPFWLASMADLEVVPEGDTAASSSDDDGDSDGDSSDPENNVADSDSDSECEVTLATPRKADDDGKVVKVKVGKVTLRVNGGDITKCEVDAIVDPPTPQYDLSKGGATSQAILKIGGRKIQEELVKKKGKTRSPVVMTGAGSLPCNTIFHIVGVGDYVALIQEVLKTAEEQEICSLAFPAIGTGGRGLPPEKMATAMLRALVNFTTEHKVEYLQDVYFTIYDESMLTTYQEVIRQKAPSMISDQGNMPFWMKLQKNMRLPETWDRMEEEDRCKIVKLDKTSSEYQEIEKKFKDSAGANGGPIVQIRRVQNPEQYNSYMVRRVHIDKQKPAGSSVPSERRLWHGTAEKAIEDICTHGLNRSFSKNAKVYGEGVYFARDAAYSCRDAYSTPGKAGIKHVFLCLVATGQFVQGASEMKQAPLKDKAAPMKGRYDSVVDKPGNPQIFVVFGDNMAYPEYIVSFK